MVTDPVVSLPQLSYFDPSRYRVVPQVLHDLHPAVPFRDGQAAPKLPALQPVGYPLIFAADLVGPVEPGLLAVRSDLSAGLARFLRRGILTVAGIISVLQQEPALAVFAAPGHVPFGEAAHQIQRKEGAERPGGASAATLSLKTVGLLLTNAQNLILYATLLSEIRLSS